MRAFTVIEVEQGSAEWFKARLGRLTGSVSSVMLSQPPKGKLETTGRRDLRLRLALEQVCGRQLKQVAYVSKAMQAGTEREPEARVAFESDTGLMVCETGFLSHSAMMAGGSLDGHIGDFEELVSIKCREWAAHIEFLKHGTIPKAAHDQIVHELWLTGAKRHRYVSWNPDFPEELQLRHVTVDRDEKEIEAYALALSMFLTEVEREVEALAKLRKTA